MTECKYVIFQNASADGLLQNFKPQLFSSTTTSLSLHHPLLQPYPATSFLNLSIILLVAFSVTVNPFYSSLPANQVILSTPVVADIYPSYIEAWDFTGTYSAYQPRSAHSLSTVPSVSFTNRGHESPTAISTTPLPSLWSIVPIQATKLNPDTLASAISLSPPMQYTPPSPWGIGPCVFAIFAVLRVIASAIPALNSAGPYWSLVWHLIGCFSCYVVQRTLSFVWQRVLQCPATVRLEDYLLLDRQFTVVTSQLVSTQAELVGATEKNDRIVSLLSSDLANAEISIKQLEHKVESLEEANLVCNAAVTVMETDLLDARSQLDAISVEHATAMSRLSSDFREQSALANELIAELEEREDEVGTIAEKNQVLEQELVQIKVQLADKDALIAAYIQQKSEDDRAIAELQGNERELEQELEETVQAWDKLLEQLDNVLAEKEYLAAEYQALCDEVDGSYEWPVEEQQRPPLPRPVERLVEIADGVYDFVEDDYEPDDDLRYVLDWAPPPLASTDAIPLTTSTTDTVDPPKEIDTIQPGSHELEHHASPAESTRTQEETASEEDEERIVFLERPVTAMGFFCNAEEAEHEPSTRPVSPFVEDSTTVQSEDHSSQLQQEAHAIHDVEDTSPSIPSITPSQLHENNGGSDQTEETEQDSEGSVGDSDPSECDQHNGGNVDVLRYSKHTSQNELETHMACRVSGSEQNVCNGTNVCEGEEKEHKSNEDYAPTGGESSSSLLGGEMRERERAVELLESFRNSNDAEHHYLLDEFIAAFESPETVLLDGSINIDETGKCDDKVDEGDKDSFDEESSSSAGYHQTTSDWKQHPWHVLGPTTEEEEEEDNKSEIFKCSTSFSALTPTPISETVDPNADAAEETNQIGERDVLEASLKSAPKPCPLRSQNGRSNGRVHLRKAPRPSSKASNRDKENSAP